MITTTMMDDLIWRSKETRDPIMINTISGRLIVGIMEAYDESMIRVRLCTRPIAVYVPRSSIECMRWMSDYAVHVKCRKAPGQ